MLVAQLTDIHLMERPEQTLRGMNTQDSLEAVLQSIRQLPQTPDVLMLTGDLANDGDISAYDRLQKAISGLAIPTYALCGNHDLGDRLRTHLTNQFIHCTQTAQLGGWQCIFLDSTVPDQIGGNLSPETLTWLKEFLREHSTSPTLIAFHHPALDLDSLWIDGMGLANKAEFWQICAQFPQVRLILNGHAHQENQQIYQGVTCLVTPSTCMQFLPKSEKYALDQERSPAYRLLELRPDGTFSTLVQWVALPEPAQLL